MRAIDLLTIAIKSIQRKWAACIACGISISVFCLYFAGNAFFTIRQEKAAPFELVVTTDSTTGITDAVLAEVRKIEAVENATPVLQIPVQLQMGEYSASVTLTGVNPSYLSLNALPEQSVMPYIVLNEAACKLFKKESEKNTTTQTAQAPKIDWLNTQANIRFGADSAATIAKVCAVLESKKGDEPTAYISLYAANALARNNGQSAICQRAYVRIKNIGHAQSVNTALGALRLTSENADRELQTKWDMQTKETIYLFVLGAFTVFCSFVLLFAWRRIIEHEQKDAHAMLHYIGMQRRDIAKLFLIRAAFIIGIGVCVGLMVALALPSFLPQDLRGISVFML